MKRDEIMDEIKHKQSKRYKIQKNRKGPKGIQKEIKTKEKIS